jgi:hypothetical protein
VGCAGDWSWFRDLRLGGILARATESIAIAALAWSPAMASSPAPMPGHEPNASRNAARLMGVGNGRPGLVSGSQTPAPYGSSHIACQPNSEHPEMKSAMARMNTALSPPPR